MRNKKALPFLGSAAILLVAACGRSDAPTAKTPDSAAPKPTAIAPAKPEPSAQKDSAPPTTCLAKERMTSLLAAGPLPPVPPANVQPKLAGFSSGAKDADTQDLYAKVAPATVLIRAADGMGTGVIIDPAGWVLTAYHVVDGAMADDFSIKVQLEIGTLAKNGPTKGLMTRGEKTYDAVVHKADKSRDLAVLKIVDPPKDLPAVKVAKKDVRPGDPITIVGHAGVGLLWAVKSGTVSTAGELGKNLASLVLLECKPEMDEEECKERKKMHDRAVANLAQMPAGLLIQSTVATTRGDSGGPVVNAAGELVGIVSFSNSDSATGVAYSYHIHGAELRRFIAQIPAKPAQITPDPWCDGGFEATLEDVDLDGKMDTLISTYSSGGWIASVQRRAVMIDLDQNHFERASGNTDAPPFDAELVSLFVEGKHYTYYDTDNDGRFDVLLVDERGGGVPTTAWKIAADGTMTRQPPSDWRSDVRPDAFTSVALGQRLARIAPIVFPGWVRGGGEAADLPDPVSGAGKKGRLVDVDGDGKPDGISLASSFSNGLLLDLDQDSLGKLGLRDDPQALLNSRGVDAEFSLVEQGQNRWAFYDSDRDGRFDLALEAKGHGLVLNVASDAWKIDASGQRTVAIEHVGRKLIRPGLLGGGPDASRLRRLAYMYPIAADEGLDSLPNPYSLENRGEAYFVELKGWPRTVAIREGAGVRSIVVDVDRSSKIDLKEDLGRALAAGKMDGEMAEVQHAGMMWMFYDTDDDGTFDLVLFSSKARSLEPERAFRLGPGGALDVDTAVAKGRWVRPSLFTKKPIGAALKRLAKELFRPEYVEEG